MRCLASLTVLTAATLVRTYATAEPDLKETLRSVIPEKRELLKKVKAVADKKIGDVKIENTLGGMRSVNAQAQSRHKPP